MSLYIAELVGMTLLPLSASCSKYSTDTATVMYA